MKKNLQGTQAPLARLLAVSSTTLWQAFGQPTALWLLIFYLVVSAYDAHSQAGSTNCPTITFPASLPSGTVGQDYNASVAVSPAGNYTYSFASENEFPISIDPQTGVISTYWTFTVTLSFTVRATDANGCYADKAYTIKINCPKLTVIPPKNGRVGEVYRGIVSTDLEYYISIGGGGNAVPAGLEIGDDGQLHGIPTQAGTFTLGFYANEPMNGCDTSGTFSLIIEPATTTCPTITFPASIPSAIVEQGYSASVAVSPAGSYTYTLVDSDVPFGLMLDPQTGLISGSVGFGGSYSFSVRATDAQGCYAEKNYTLTINCPSVSFYNPPKGRVGESYEGSVSASGNLGYYVYVQGYPMPEGLFAYENNLIGTPTQAGTYTLKVGAIAEAQRCYSEGTVQLVIEPASTPIGTSRVRINCGGSDFKVANGLTFKADTYYSGVTKTSLTGGEIAGTVNDPIYYTDRVANVDKGTFQYQIPVANGKYQVNLFFAETYFTSAGKRVMSVIAEGNPILTNYDIFASQGKRTARMLSYIVTVADGNVTLDFSASVNRPKINAIEVIPAPASAAREEGESELASELTSSVLVAYPNPFADQTSIRFTAEVTGKASVAVYDLSGSLVKGLFEGELEAGVPQELTLEGSSLPSGIYLVKATSPAGVRHLKLVLAK